MPEYKAMTPGTSLATFASTFARMLAQQLGQDFLPAYCLVCDQRCTQLTWLCGHCRHDVDINPWPCPRCALPGVGPRGYCHCHKTTSTLSRAEAPLLYTKTPRALIKRWKFDRRIELTHLLLKLALEGTTAKRSLLSHRDYDVAIPIGMPWRTRLSRGFNQSHCLALALQSSVKTLAATPVVSALSSASRKRAQHHLSRAARLTNAAQRFSVGRSVSGLRILLVDDVLTTGATVESAAQALLNAGAARVDAWCLARSLPPESKSI